LILICVCVCEEIEIERAYLLSLIFVIKPSTVVTTPPIVRLPLVSSKSSSGIFILAVSD
jgi:hypothetical protein